MAYNLTAEGVEANRNAGYVPPTNYGVTEPGGATVGTPPPATAAPSGPRLKFSSSNVGASQWGKDTDGPKLGLGDLSPYDPFTRNLLKSIARNAASDGLTPWGLSVLKTLGQPIKPAWLKESSKEWFDKPLPDPMVPPKGDFLKFVEPSVITDKSREGWGQNIADGLVTSSIRDDTGFGGLWKKYHTEIGDLEAQYEKLPAYLNPKKIAAKAALYDSEGRALPGTSQTPLTFDPTFVRPDFNQPANPWAGVVTANDIAIQNNPWINGMQTGMTREQQAQFEIEQKLRSSGLAPGAPISNVHGGGGTNLAGPNPNAAQDENDRQAREQAWNSDPATLAARDRYSFNPTGMTPAQIRQADRDVLNRFKQDRSVTPQTFLPPYLQGGTSTSTGAAPVIGGPGAAMPSIQLPGTSPVALSVVPQVGAILPTPGAPIAAPAPAPFSGVAGIGGGFAPTAAMLELPFYLRSLGGIGRPNRRMSYG